MPLFLDAHSMKDFDRKTLLKAQNSPIDEFGVKHQNILYNSEADKIFCLLDAPNIEAVKKHHEKKYAIKCEWIIEVKTTA
jgi:hypothetical protein